MTDQETIVNPNTVRKICSDQRGATAVEYAVMASLIAAVIVAVVTTLGSNVAALFEAVSPPWG